MYTQRLTLSQVNIVLCVEETNPESTDQSLQETMLRIEV
jgi:hypothetical protein